jgi:hypothetical protein
MTLKLQHPFILIVAGPSCCGKSTFVIRLLECREQLCDIVFENILWCHSENNAPLHLKIVSFVKSVPDFENTDKVPTLIVLDDLMDSAYSTKVSELITKGPRLLNISLVVITQNLFYQGQSSRTISPNRKYITMFKNPRDKSQIVYLARQVYPENISSFHKAYLKACKDPHYYLFLDLTQSINVLLRFRTKIFPAELTEVFTPVQSNEPIKVTFTLSPRP